MVGVDTNTSKWVFLNSGQLPLSILPDLCCFVCLLSLLVPLSMRKISALKNAAFSPKKNSHRGPRKLVSEPKNCLQQL